MGSPVLARSVSIPRADWVTALLFQLHAVNRQAFGVREFRFSDQRKWRFDLAFPDKMVAVEIDGGSWIGGRHTSGAGFEKDCEKLNEAICLGWRVLRVTPRQVESGEALGWLERALA